MKFNKWTLGLAAVGVVSLASAARADEKMNALQTALSNTTISGYVSASFNWAIQPGGAENQSSPAGFIPFQGQYSENGVPSKQDGFNLDVVKLSISKPEDESPWASGYQIDLIFGPDAVNYNSSANAVGGQSQQHFTGENGADFAIKQAYVTLRTPVGNGIDWKIGVFDSPLGYEVFDAGSNPNYTRSWGYAIEPTELTGILGTYKINDSWSISAGIANTLIAGINARNDSSGFPNHEGSYWHKAYTGSVAFTAPSSWGWAAGSSMYAGVIYGFGSSQSAGFNGYMVGNQVNYYAGATLNTPWKQLTTGVSFDYAHNLGGGSETGNYFNAMAIGLYGTFKATDKLSFNARGEYIYAEGINSSTGIYQGSSDGMELTGTVEYDLWANVVSRVELRYDHLFGSNELLNDGGLDHRTSVGLYANIIYKF